MNKRTKERYRILLFRRCLNQKSISNINKIQTIIFPAYLFLIAIAGKQWKFTNPFGRRVKNNQFWAITHETYFLRSA